MSKLQTSKQSGPHSRLHALCGQWQGTTKVWFEPGQLADESPCEGRIEPFLGGNFVSHTYTGSMQGKPLQGFALIGYDVNNEHFECAWVDTFHMSTGILHSKGADTGSVIQFTGSYDYPQVPEPWGWRTELHLQGATLVITAYNITPDGQEAKAVETIYQRVEQGF